MKVDGLHHVTAITADIDANLEFYGRVLALRLIWQGVNADDPGMRHVAYGDERGSPGSIVTFFDMPGVVPGQAGAGTVHRLVFRVASEETLDFWERRLDHAGVAGDRMADRLVFADPEGLGLELVIDDGEDESLIAAAAGVDERHAIRGMHAVRAYSAEPKRSARMVGEVLGMEPEGADRWLSWEERRHSLVIYDEAPEKPGRASSKTAAPSSRGASHSCKTRALQRGWKGAPHDARDRYRSRRRHSGGRRTRTLALRGPRRRGDRRLYRVPPPPGPDRLRSHAIDPRFEGQGLGSQLVRTALADARSEGLSVLPFCPFVRGYIAGHTEYLDLVPEDMRAKFELPAHG